MAGKKELKFGVSIPQGLRTQNVDSSAIAPLLTTMESWGFDGCWVGDHPTSRFDLAAVPLLSYAAALTTTLRLGTSILLSALRNPIQLARELSTLDRLSNGRLILGVGIGGPHHHRAMAMPTEDRSNRYEEGITLVKRLWTEEKVTFRGHVFEVEDIAITPKPFQVPCPPIWFGGHAMPALERAVRLGDGWIEAGHSSTEVLKHEIAVVRRLLDKAGRDPGTFTLCKRVLIAIDDNRETAVKSFDQDGALDDELTRRANAAGVFGSSEECIEGLAEIAETGVDVIILSPPAHNILEQVERLAEQVLPSIQTS